MTIVGALLIGVAIFVAVQSLWPQARPVSQLSDAAREARQIDPDRSATRRVLDPVVASVGQRLRHLTPDGLVGETERKLQVGGYGPDVSVERVLALKAVFAVVGVLLGALILGPALGGALLPALLLGFVGFVAPDAVVNRRADDRTNRLQRHLPDMIDQISVTVEAGLGFEQALVRTSHSTTGDLGVELRRAVRDIQLGMSRPAALDAMAERSGVEDLGRFVRAVRLAERQGLPLATTLNVQSAEIRNRLQLAAEERAMQLPVKLTFPLVLFILPALFLVILGPAFIQIREGF